MTRYLQSLLLLVLSACVFADICQDSVCEYDFQVHRTRTMVVKTDVSTFEVGLNGTDLVILENMYRLKNRYPDSIGHVVDVDDFIMADGYQRNIIAINDQMPGPIIEVMEGAQVNI